MDELNNVVGTEGTGYAGTQEAPVAKMPLKVRLNAKMCIFRANHPVLCKTAKWVGRAGIAAGGFLIGRKTVQPKTVYVTPIPADTTEEPAESTEPSEEPAAEENE